MCEVRDIADTRKVIAYELKNGYKGVTAPFFFSGKKDLAEEDEHDPMAMEILTSSGIDTDQVESWHLRAYLEPGVVYISNHAMMRLNKRLGWKKSTAIRMVRRIYDNGKTKEDTDNIIQRWIEDKEKAAIRNPNAEICYRIYGQYILIFDGQLLVTAYNMSNPSSMRAAAIKHKGYNRAAFKRGECVA